MRNYIYRDCWKLISPMCSFLSMLSANHFQLSISPFSTHIITKITFYLLFLFGRKKTRQLFEYPITLHLINFIQLMQILRWHIMNMNYNTVIKTFCACKCVWHVACAIFIIEQMWSTITQFSKWTIRQNRQTVFFLQRNEKVV